MENDVLTCDECNCPIEDYAIVVGDNAVSGVYCSDDCLYKGLLITIASPKDVLNDNVVF
jgi:hypothetical protein